VQALNLTVTVTYIVGSGGLLTDKHADAVNKLFAKHCDFSFNQSTVVVQPAAGFECVHGDNNGAIRQQSLD